MSTLIYKEHKITKWEAPDGFMCYLLTDFGNLLGNRIRNSIGSFGNKELVSNSDRIKYNIVTKQEYKDYARTNNKMTLITPYGLTRIICTSRSPNSVDIAEKFNINIHANKFVREETDLMSAIRKTFIGETIKFQYIVPGTNFRLDAYFPDHNISIECDEYAHRYQIAADAHRQEIISRILNCHWVRFSTTDDNIFECLGKIYALREKNNRSTELSQ